MRSNRLNWLLAIAGTVVGSALAGIVPAQAQDYPSRPVTMIVPFPAGGPTDTISRIMAERMRGSLGQPVIIENVVGAAGGMATWSTHVANAVLYQLQYDVITDFDPVSLVVETPLLLVAKKAMPASDLK